MASASGGNSNLMEKAKNGGRVPANPSANVWNYIKGRQEALAKALPQHITAEKMAMVAFTEIRKNPKLLECHPASLFGAIMQASQLGMMPGPLGECYFVPFWNSKTRSNDVQFMLGYKGMLSLARRSGQLKTLQAHCVYEADTFELEFGEDPKLRHVPVFGQDRGNIIGAYAVAKFKDGGSHFEFLPIEEILRRRDRSKGKGSGPWQTDFEAMVMKTVVRYMFRWLPSATETMLEAAAKDDGIIRGENPDTDMVMLDVEPEVTEALPEEAEPEDAVPEQGKSA